MYVYKLVPGSLWIANGGPANARPAEKATPTRAGRFVIGSIGQHISSVRWPNSAIPWGAPLQLNAKGYVELKLSGRWQLLHTVPGWQQYAAQPLEARKALQNMYKSMMDQLKPKYGLGKADHWPTPWGGALPKTWVFNDFGPVAVKYFADYNNNRKLDAVAKPGQRREELLSDFMHTTPFGEVAATLDRQLPSSQTMLLGESHGCIHMDPTFLRKWVAAGILVVGATLEIHPYREDTVPNSFERATGQVGREIHFFPGAQGIALYQVTHKQLGQALHPAHG